MQQTCTNCNGDGIVGNGDKPWMKEGHLHGCEVCKGTGKVPASNPGDVAAPIETEPPAGSPVDTQESTASTETQPADVEEKKDEQTAESAGPEAGTEPGAAVGGEDVQNPVVDSTLQA